MLYQTRFIYIPEYQYTSTNQHGDRYKKIRTNPIKAACLSVKTCSTNEEELKRLILLGHHLGIPPKYLSTEPQHTIEIEVVAADEIRKFL